VDIAIETDSVDLIAQLQQLPNVGDLLTSERRGIDGASLITAILSLTAALIPAVVSILKAQIAARKHVKVTRQGVVIQGVSEATLLALLETERQRGTRGQR
jgi:hypothetical protein